MTHEPTKKSDLLAFTTTRFSSSSTDVDGRRHVCSLSSLLFSILSDSKLWDNRVVYPKADAWLLLGDAVAGRKCFDYGTLRGFRNVNAGISHGWAAASADGFLTAERDRERMGFEGRFPLTF